MFMCSTVLHVFNGAPVGGGRQGVNFWEKEISDFYPDHGSDEVQVLALNPLPSYPNPWVRSQAPYTGITDNRSATQLVSSLARGGTVYRSPHSSR